MVNKVIFVHQSFSSQLLAKGKYTAVKKTGKGGKTKTLKTKQPLPSLSSPTFTPPNPRKNFLPQYKGNFPASSVVEVSGVKGLELSPAQANLWELFLYFFRKIYACSSHFRSPVEFFSGKSALRVLKQAWIQLSFDYRVVQGRDFCKLCGITLTKILGQPWRNKEQEYPKLRFIPEEAYPACLHPSYS